MTGIELSRKYYQSNRELLLSEFTQIEDKLCIGLTGEGSECYGFDDDVSTDHDFEPGFCIFIPGEDVVDRKTAFLLERAYAKLPKEFEGYSRSKISPVGGSRHGVLRTDEYFEKKVGLKCGTLTIGQWLSLPSYALFEAINGEIFIDNYKEVTNIREYLCNMPEDIRLKRIAGNLLIMAQSGQYNYQRTIRHKELAAAQLSVIEFVKHTMEVVFLLNKKYMPYYKWSFKSMRDLEKLSIVADTCEFLLTTPNDKEIAQEKYFMIEDTASSIIEELQRQEITKAICGDLEKHAYSVNDLIQDSEIRNMNILCSV